MPGDTLRWSRRARARSAIGEHWLGFALVGGALSAAGLFAVGGGLLLGGSDPGVLSVLVGGLLLVVAPVHVALGVQTRQSPSKLPLNLVLAVVYVAAGVAFLVEPYAGLVRFEPLLGGFLLVHGLALAGFGIVVFPAPYWYAVVGGGGFSVLTGLFLVDGTAADRSADVIVFGLAFFVVGASLVVVAYGSRDWIHPLARSGWL